MWGLNQLKPMIQSIYRLSYQFHVMFSVCFFLNSKKNMKKNSVWFLFCMEFAQMIVHLL